MYLFHLKQKDQRRILTVFHLLIALILVFDISHVHEPAPKDWFFTGMAGTVAVLLATFSIFQKKLLTTPARQLGLLWLESFMMLSGAIYFWSRGASLVAFSHGVVAGVIILFGIYLRRKFRGETITVSENEIIIPGFSSARTIAWIELNNVVKRADLLTIDFRNNKLLQVEIENDELVTDDEFNNYCHARLSADRQAANSRD
ncbi:MAG TPA: hypothetical protein VGC95_13495 [Chitinophagaceae bacterium]